MSRWPFELFLALRYLRPKRTFVSVITVISVIGVILGVAVLIIVISVMTGFDRELRERILGFKAHLQVTQRDAPMTNYLAVMRAVASNENVKGVAPFILGQVMVKTQPQSGNPHVVAPWVRGLDPRFETNVSVLCTSVVAGAFDLDGYSVLVGTEFARSMRLNVGDHLAVYSQANLEKIQKLIEELEKRRGQTNQEIALPEETRLADDYTVRGIFDVGYFEYNSSVIVTSLENAQDLYRLEDAAHGLLVMLRDPFQAGAVRASLHRALGGDYEISLWTEQNSILLNALVVEKNMMFYLLFFIVIVAAFGIMNSQITSVVQKTREIGALKALGATRAQVLWLFLSQSLVVGVLGVSGGFGLGMLALAYRNEFLHFMNRMTGLELFPAEIYCFTELPALIVPGDVALICGSALAICGLAGLIPAWTAGRLRPVEALRHE
jgi:lipoprotein-releasing system permease protein